MEFTRSDLVNLRDAEIDDRAAIVRDLLTETIADTFEKADRVLKGVLDGLALQFKTSAPAFYADYENARAIVDHSAKRAGETRARRARACGIAVAALYERRQGIEDSRPRFGGHRPPLQAEWPLAGQAKSQTARRCSKTEMRPRRVLNLIPLASMGASWHRYSYSPRFKSSYP